MLPSSRGAGLAEDPLVKVSSPGVTSGRRIDRLKPETMTTRLWNSGTYHYDGAGNITGIGSDSFQYDAVNRLTSSTVQGLTQTQADVHVRRVREPSDGRRAESRMRRRNGLRDRGERGRRDEPAEGGEHRGDELPRELRRGRECDAVHGYGVRVRRGGEHDQPERRTGFGVRLRGECRAC